MREITVSAKTVDDAITEASIQLGVTSDRMDVEVIEKGSLGFFGIGSKQAVIRVCVKEEKKEEVIAPVVEEAKEEKVEVKAEPKTEVKKESKKNFKKENKEHKKDFKKDRKDNKKEIKKEVKKEIPVVKEEPKAEEKVEKKAIEVAVVEDATKKACEEFLIDVLKAMGMESVELVTTIDEDGALAIEMKGDNMGILIGKRGQTLDSLQYLTNRVANKCQDGYVRVKLDTEDYRRRRKQTLENLAKNIAYKVKRSRKPVSLEPMNPYERRIIHSALQADDRVSTHSEGEEPYRRVVVTPNRR